MFLDVSEIIAVNIKRIGQSISTLESIQNREETCVLVILRKLNGADGIFKEEQTSTHGWGISVVGRRVQFPLLDRAKLIVILITSA